MKISFYGNSYTIGNRAGLKLLNTINTHLQQHCFECDRELIGQAIPYNAVMIGQSGLLCPECAAYIQQKFTIEAETINDNKSTEDATENSHIEESSDSIGD